MAETKIGWCSTALPDGTLSPGYTFNPWIGCQKVSSGCKNCYAEDLMTRKKRWENCWGPPESTERLKTSVSYWKDPLKWNRRAQELGVRLKVFCGSLMDVFEDNAQVVPWRDELFQIIDRTPSLDWLLLTKRPENIQRMWPWGYYDEFTAWPNIWLGTSIENQETANERIPHLLNVPAYKRFLSAEPLLGPIELMKNEHTTFGDADWDGELLWFELFDWFIIGGESGRNRRPMEVEWMQDLWLQCFGRSVFIKQDNAAKPGQQGRISDALWKVKDIPS